MDLSIRHDSEVVDPSVAPLLQSTILTTYFQVAIVTLLFYDIITTIDKEVRYFWRTPRSIVNFVYFANRYVGLLGAVSYLYWGTYRANPTLCKSTGWVLDVSNLITRVLIDYILMIRVLALHSQDASGRLSVLLKVLFVMEECFRFGVLIYSVLAEDILVEWVADSVMLCGIGRTLSLKLLVIVWIVPMAYELLIMALALYKASQFWRMSAGFRGFALVKVVIQDQVIYFILVVSCCVFNMLQIEIQGSNVMTRAVIGALGSTSFLCVLGSRMLFNLKEAGEQGLNEGTSYRMARVSSDMVFS